MNKNASTTLSVLTGAALSLPGMVSEKAHAETAPDKHTASYRFTQYSEADLDEVASGSESRYDIKVNQFQFSGPIDGGKSYTVGIGHESMSGASPWSVEPVAVLAEDENGEQVQVGLRPVQVMSGASIEEQRVDVNVGFDIYESSSKFGFGFGVSVENDYTSISGSMNHASFFNDKNTTFNLSAGISSDTINPTDAGAIGINGSITYPTRPTEEQTKQSLSVAAGVSHVINKELLLGTSVNYVVYNGYLSDPYKLAWVVGEDVGDSRPDARRQAAINFQARWFVSRANAALHGDYRLFNTDWGTTSHTINVAWFQNIGRFQVIPRLRYYNQSAANFYRNFYLSERADGYYSSDYRLSQYQAISFRLKGQYNFNAFRLHATFETYNSFSSDDDPQTGENPGLVDFSFFSVGADYRW